MGRGWAFLASYAHGLPATHYPAPLLLDASAAYRTRGGCWPASNARREEGSTTSTMIGSLTNEGLCTEMPGRVLLGTWASDKRASRKLACIHSHTGDRYANGVTPSRCARSHQLPSVVLVYVL